MPDAQQREAILKLILRRATAGTEAEPSLRVGRELLEVCKLWQLLRMCQFTDSLLLGVELIEA